MPILKSEAHELIVALKEEIVTTIENHGAFLRKIADDDDWSFVIKAHALIETALTQLLIDSVGDEKCKRLFERLPIADEQYGKIALAKDLDLLTKEQRRFVRVLSTLRNKLVHRMENIGFTFQEYVAKMDNKEKKAWIESVTFFRFDSVSKQRPDALNNPKEVLWMGIYVIVALCAANGCKRKGFRKIEAVAAETAEKLLKEAREGKGQIS